MAKVQIVFYSMYGHVYQLAEAVAEESFGYGSFPLAGPGAYVG